MRVMSIVPVGGAGGDFTRDFALVGDGRIHDGMGDDLSGRDRTKFWHGPRTMDAPRRIGAWRRLQPRRETVLSAEWPLAISKTPIRLGGAVSFPQRIVSFPQKTASFP